MLFARLLACSVGFHLTLLAPEVLLVGLLFISKLASAVDHSTKVGFLTIIALVEGTVVHRKLQ